MSTKQIASHIVVGTTLKNRVGNDVRILATDIRSDGDEYPVAGAVTVKRDDGTLRGVIEQYTHDGRYYARGGENPNDLVQPPKCVYVVAFSGRQENRTVEQFNTKSAAERFRSGRINPTLYTIVEVEVK